MSFWHTIYTVSNKKALISIFLLGTVWLGNVMSIKYGMGQLNICFEVGMHI